MDILGFAFGVAGALVLATCTPVSRYGWLLFLASNMCWLSYAFARGELWLLAQQVLFTGTSLLGMWRGLLLPSLRCRAAAPAPARSY